MLAQRDVTTQDGTVLSVVYVTAEPTFTGVIGGYTTLTDAGSAESTTSSSGGQTLIPPAVASSSSSAAASFTGVAGASQSSLSSAAVASTTSRPLTSAASTFLTSASDTSNFNGASNTAVAGAASTSSSSDSSPSSSSSSSGMSTGAKAGLAIAILAIIGIIAALLLWVLGKKKRQQKEESRANDEKTTFGASNNAVPMTSNPTSTTAPRLSLRPMSRMMDGFMGNSNRRSGNLLNTISESAPAPGAARNMTPSPQPGAVSPLRQEKPQPRPQHENPFADPQNPFADPEKSAVPTPIRVPPQTVAIAPAQPSPAPRTKFSPSAAPPVERNAMRIDPPSPAPAPPSSSHVAPLAAGAAAIGVAAAARRRPESPGPAVPIQAKPLASPERAREEAASPNPDSAPMPPSVAAGGVRSTTPTGPEAAGGNVYRVLMDFVPSMDDELDLKTGQLVRMLHEYDDGWALCIRLDRSQQGVVPRTCLAAKPSKPKPSHLAQYARGPGGNGRPMSPAGMPGRPMSPAGDPRGRSMSPAGGPAGRMNMTPPGSAGMGPNYNSPRASPGARGPPPGRPMSPGGFNQAPRPLSPGPQRPQKRSQSPGPYGASGPMPMAAIQRRRSNSASALNLRDKRMSPPGPSNLGPGGRPGMQGGPYPGGMRPMSPGIAL